jgi:hypothetical protein
MKKYFSSVVFWCWAWYILAHVADMLTSLRRWGCFELNPYFRDASHRFVALHGLIGKSTLTLALAGVSYLAYRLVAPLDKRWATLLASVLPLWYGWLIWRVVDSNLFVILRWVNP